MKEFIKEYWKVILGTVVVAVVMTWWCIFSPWAKYTVTDEQLHEMAIEYDQEHGTDYAKWEE